MNTEKLLRGESKNIEYKSVLPEQSEKYIKSIIAFANTQGGKILIFAPDIPKFRAVCPKPFSPPGRAGRCAPPRAKSSSRRGRNAVAFWRLALYNGDMC